MKNTIRVRKNGATKRTASQPQNPVSKFQAKCRRAAANPKGRRNFPNLAEFVIPDNDCHPSCLAIVCRESGHALKKIPLSESEFHTLLLRNSCRDGGSEFVAAAIREKLKDWPSEVRLETPIQNAVALLDLLMSKICDKDKSHLVPSHPDFDFVLSAEICGMINQCADAKKQLVETFYQREKSEMAS